MKTLVSVSKQIFFATSPDSHFVKSPGTDMKNYFRAPFLEARVFYFLQYDTAYI